MKTKTQFSFVFGVVNTIHFDQDSFIKVMQFLNNKVQQSNGLSQSRYTNITFNFIFG